MVSVAIRSMIVKGQQYSFVTKLQGWCI